MDPTRMLPDQLVIVLWVENWSDMLRRGLARPPDRLVQSALTAVGPRSLLVANPPRGVLSTTLKRASGRGEPPLELPDSATSRTGAPQTSARLVQPLMRRRRLPTNVDALRSIFGRFGRTVARASRGAGQHYPPLVTFSPLVAAFSDLAWAGNIVYYARDDWAAHPLFEPYWPAYEEAYACIRQQRLPVVAVSQGILDRLEPTARSQVLPNGIDPAEWLSPRPLTERFAHLPRPLLVYVGTLDDRLDPDTLGILADRFAGGSLVLAGPLVAESALATVVARPNVHAHHLADRRELLGLLAHADVGLVPHRRTPLTETMSPLKIYEYLAAGRPVVATDLAGCRHIDRNVRLSDIGVPFADAVANALSAGPIQEAERPRIIARHDWASRHHELFSLLAEPRRAPGR